MSCKTPILFIIFKRPDLTQKVFDVIRQAQPKHLIVFADGPRDNKELYLCEQTRAIINNVDWDCEVIKKYSNVNLGCRENPLLGINWAFSKFEELIILEDDCLPHFDFFAFCDELLETYRYDERIMLISGSNLLRRSYNYSASYIFSSYASTWGWASWRRAWNYNDIQIKLLNEALSKNFLENIFLSRRDREKWERRLINIFNQDEKYLSAWDYQWLFSRWIQNGLGIVPSKNLISNIGFGSDSTHTKNILSEYNNLCVHGLEFPIIHPKLMVREINYDKAVFQDGSFSIISLLRKSFSILWRVGTGLLAGDG
jgi:hypothetical protein